MSTPAPIAPPYGTLQLFPYSSAANVLDLVLDGFPYSDATIYGNAPDRRVALFDNGLAAGLKLESGVIFGTNDLRVEQQPDWKVNFDYPGPAGVTFNLQPQGAESNKGVLLQYCSCDVPNFDFARVKSPGAGEKSIDLSLLDGDGIFRDNGYPMPKGQLANDGRFPGQDPGQACRCLVEPLPVSLSVGSTLSQLGISYDTVGNAWVIVGSGKDLVTTTTTSTVTTVTSTATISTASTTSTPFTTTTVTPSAVNVAASTTVTSTITSPPASTVTVPAASATKTVQQIELSFEKACCPKSYCRKAKGKKQGVLFGRSVDADLLAPRQEPVLTAGPNDPLPSSTILSGTLSVTVFRTLTVPAAETSTVFTATVTEPESIIATETAATPTITTGTNTQVDMATITATNPTVTAAPTATVTAVQTIKPAKLICPKKKLSQKQFAAAGKFFLDSYKRFAPPGAPAIVVKCDGDSNTYVY